MALKDLKALTREKTILLAILLLISISSLAQIIAMGLSILYSPSFYQKVDIGLVGNAPIFESIAKPVKYKSLDKALEDLRKGKIYAVVVLNENATGVNYVTVYIPKEDVKAIKVIPYLRIILMDYQDRLRSLKGIPILRVQAYDFSGNRIDVPEGISVKFRFIYTVLIPLLVVLTAVILGVYVVDVMCEELETKTIDVLAISVSLRDVVVGKVIASIVVALLLTSMWILALIVNGISIDVPLTAFSAFTFYHLFIPIALITSAIVKNRERSQLVFSLTAIPIILLFLSFGKSPLGLVVKSSLSTFDETLIVYALTSVLLTVLAVEIAVKEVEKLFK